MQAKILSMTVKLNMDLALESETNREDHFKIDVEGSEWAWEHWYMTSD
jgi:hypothetical protein